MPRRYCINSENKCSGYEDTSIIKKLSISCSLKYWVDGNTYTYRIGLPNKNWDNKITE